MILADKRNFDFRRALALAGLAAGLIASGHACATPSIVVDVASGEVVSQEDATKSWYPASLTKLMTVYVALNAAADGRISLSTPLVVSPRAARMAPSKMGFRPGTEVTLDNALKMLMVKSANDIAVTIAEGVSGSVDAFAKEMNAAAARIGMRESHFANPNGLPDSSQVTSARDMAQLGRALYVQFPDQAQLFNIGALQLGRQIINTHNGMLGRYPGADGMKTGFTCSAGFNLVGSATRGGRKLIVVVMGAPSATTRTIKAASLLDRGFASSASGGSLLSLSSFGVGSAPDMRDEVCRNRGKATAQFMAEIEDMAVPLGNTAAMRSPEGLSMFDASAAQRPQASGSRQIASLPRPYFEPIPVFVGRVPGWTGTVAHADDYDPAVKTTATAYAGEKEEADNPLKPAADALPMKRRGAKTMAKVEKPAVKIDKVKEPVKAAKVAAKPAAAKAKVAAKPDAVKTASAKAKPASAKPASAKPSTIKTAAAKHKPAGPKAAKVDE